MTELDRAIGDDGGVDNCLELEKCFVICGLREPMNSTK